MKRMLRRRLLKDVMDDLHAERRRYAQVIMNRRDPLRPSIGESYTDGTYAGLTYAIIRLEGER